MVKKIILGTLFARMVGLLIFGAVNRTIAKNESPVSRGLKRTNEVSSVLGNEEEIEVSAGNGS